MHALSQPGVGWFWNRERWRAGKTLLFSTHIISLVEEIADEIVFLLEGNIYFKGKLERIKQDHDTDSLEKSIAMILEKEKYA